MSNARLIIMSQQYGNREDHGFNITMTHSKYANAVLCVTIKAMLVFHHLQISMTVSVPITARGSFVEHVKFLSV